MTKRAAMYVRVSTGEQNTENQRRELLAIAERFGWEIVATYEDAGVSGAKGRDKRPEFDRLLKGVVLREFDVIMVWSVDRLGRSLQHLVEFLGEIHAKGVDLYCHQQSVDTTTPAGKAMFQMCGAFAEFERAMIQERVKAGLERARAQGKILGRPKVTKGVERSVRRLRESGVGKRKIAKQLGIGVSTVMRVLQESQAA